MYVYVSTVVTEVPYSTTRIAIMLRNIEKMHTHTLQVTTMMYRIAIYMNKLLFMAIFKYVSLRQN